MVLTVMVVVVDVSCGLGLVLFTVGYGCGVDANVQDETFGIMNLLEDCLKVSNSAVVLAATKCFLSLTADLPEIRAQVWTLLSMAVHPQRRSGDPLNTRHPCLFARCTIASRRRC